MPYMDYAATSPMRPAAREAWLSASEASGNAASLHAAGRRAEARVEKARRQVAALVGRSPREVLFTSGGTEANNMALLGAMRRLGKPHLIVSAIEHKAVLQPAAALEREGVRVTRLPVDATGLVRLDALEAALDDETGLVSVMLVNNEIGTVQPIEAIAELARARGALVHTDAVQAGLLPLTDLPADMISLSAHKLGGPMGVGALVCRPGVPLAPIMHGGGHERGLRPGTVNVPGVSAFGAAAEALLAEREAEAARVGAMRDRLQALILAGLPDAPVVGAGAPVAPHLLALAFPGLDGEGLVTQLDLAGLMASSGAACTALGTEPSHVLPELGLDMAAVNGSLRLSLGFATTEAEVDEAARTVVEVVRRLRTMRPMAIDR